jgi:hypothetical protein
MVAQAETVIANRGNVTASKAGLSQMGRALITETNLVRLADDEQGRVD